MLFFNVGLPKENIFLNTFYGLYFSHQYTNITNFIYPGLDKELLCNGAMLNFFNCCEILRDNNYLNIVYWGLKISNIKNASYGAYLGRPR